MYSVSTDSVLRLSVLKEVRVLEHSTGLLAHSGLAMCFSLESDGKIYQSRYDFQWAGQKLKLVGLHEGLGGAEW